MTCFSVLLMAAENQEKGGAAGETSFKIRGRYPCYMPVDAEKKNLMGIPGPNRGVGWNSPAGAAVPPGAGRAHRHAPAKDNVHPGEKIAIVTSDIHPAPMPTWGNACSLLDRIV